MSKLYESNKREAAMNKTGMTRTPTPFAPKPKTNPVEVFVVHVLPSRTRITFNTFKPAFKEFTKRMKANERAALFAQRPSGWEKLYMSETYPPALSEPYINADV